MTDGAIVKVGSVEVDYLIREWLVGESRGEPEFKYDWIAGRGDDSDELFDSADEAEQDAISHLGG